MSALLGRALSPEVAIVIRNDRRWKQRFWAKVALPDENGCMLWLGQPDGHGYGRFSFQGKLVGAHRVSLMLSVGDQPANTPYAIHACRNKHCVAPAHLRWATPSENQADTLRDGTHVIGDRNAQAKLTSGQVLEIVALLAQGHTPNTIGSIYGVSGGVVRDIRSGRRWARLTGRGVA